MSTSNRLDLAELPKIAGSTPSSKQEKSRSVGLDFFVAGRFARDQWPAGVLAIAVLVLYAPVLAGLMADWYSNSDYSHGFFVPLLSGYLVWRKHDKLAELDAKPTFSGLLIVLGSIGLLFLGSLGAELFLTRVAFVGTIAGLIIYFFGWTMLRAVAFPVAFLLLMIPLPVIVYNEIVFPLQLLASQFATAVLDFVNLFPVVREGNILVLPHNRLEVVEACSGIRSLMSLLTLALGYAYLAERDQWIRGMLVFVMIPLAVVSNGFRVVGSALLTYFWGPKVADGFMHSFSGWAIFMVATTLLLLLHGVVRAVRAKVGGSINQ